MSENIQSISNGSFVLGNTNELTFSAGPGIKIDQPSEGVVRIGNDETVLFFAGNDSSGHQSGNLTESIKNFETVKVVGMDNDAHIDVKYIYPQWTHNADNGTANVANYEVMFYGANPYQNTVWEKWVKYSFSALTAFTVSLGYEGSYTANTISNVTNNHKFSVREVIGINRVSGGNA